MLKGILVGILVGVWLVCGCAYYYFASGRAPVATKAPEIPFEHKLTHVALDAYLDKLPHPNPAVPQDENNFLEGAKVYKEQCALCHGLPGEPKTAIAEGMFPPPPQLFRGTGVTDDEPWETYWKVYGGIRMTGMPGFGERLGETKIWQVSVLLKNADKISPAVKAELATVPAPAAPPTASAPAPASAAPAHN
jgi:mono/diheme cytochrome c family protein